MSTETVCPVERRMPTTRISAYECDALPSGQVVRRRRYVSSGGWYGAFSEEMLRETIMPKLAEYAIRGWSYPFLITSHQLRKGTAAHIHCPPKGKAKVQDLTFDPRGKRTQPTPVAVVFSSSEYRLLS